MAGRKPHKPTDALRRQIEAMSGYGIPQEDIGGVVGLSVVTLHKYYRDELDNGATKANARVAESLYKKATGEGQGAVAAAIFWMKTRAGWRETTRIEHEGLDKVLDGITRDELKALAGTLVTPEEDVAGGDLGQAGGEPAGGLSTVH